MKNYLAPVVLSLSLGGCVSVPMADATRNAEVKQFAPKKEVGQIYVCRNSRTFGMGIRPDIEVNGKIVGVIPRSTFIYQELKPGYHTIVSKTLEHDSKFPFEITAGEQKFFQVWISLGFFAGWGLIDEIDAAKGRACVSEGELVESAN